MERKDFSPEEQEYSVWPLFRIVMLLGILAALVIPEAIMWINGGTVPAQKSAIMAAK